MTIMTEEDEGALAARLGVIETMLAWLLADMIKRSSRAPAAAIEVVRAICSEMAPKSSPVRDESSAQMRAFRKQWDHRIDTLFGDAAALIARLPN
jgi:hypothetical protein